MRRMLAMVAVLAIVAAACGGDGAIDAGPVPGRPDTTVTTTETPATTPATTAAGTTQVSVWLARGEKLEPVTRTVPSVPRIGAEAVKALLAGPTAAETRNGFTTAVPKDTRFLDLVIDGAGIAKVDLSRDFESGGGTLGLTLRLGQVACTVGQFPTVKGVRFALNGELVSVFSGNGIVLDKPVTCDSYREVAGPARVDAGLRRHLALRHQGRAGRLRRRRRPHLQRPGGDGPRLRHPLPRAARPGELRLPGHE